MFRVICEFFDLKDNEHHYRAGDEYPRPGVVADEARVAELTGSGNKIGKPVIEAVEAPVEAADEQSKEIPAEAKEKPRRGRRSREKG